MDSNQSEQQYYVSKLTSNIISPVQYPCTMIGSNKNNIHTIVPNSNNNSLNINVKYQNSSESKLAQSISYNCYSNNANSSFNQNDDLKFLFNGKPKKIPHTKRLKGAIINQCIDNSNDITAAPNQLTILVQKVLPAQVPEYHPPLSVAAHVSAAQSIPSVISPPLEQIVASPINLIPHVTIDTIASVINDVITKATSKDPHDDVFLSVIKSRCDSSSPNNNNHTQFIPPNKTTPQFVDVNIDSNHKRPSNISLDSPSIINKRSPNKRPRLTETTYNDTKSYQRCQLSAPNFRKLVHEPRISDKCLVLPPLGVSSQQRPCLSLDQLKFNCVKYKRLPFLLSQPYPRTVYQDRYIVENLNANIPSGTLITSHDIVDDIYCIVAPSPNNNDLDYLSVFTSDQVSSPSINLSGPNLEMLHPPQRTLSPQLSLFHCPNKGYLRLDHSLPPSSNISHKYVSTPTSDPLSDTSIVDSETGEMVTSTMKPHQKLQFVTKFTSNHLHNDDFSMADEDTLQLKSTEFIELPLYSEKVYKSTSLQWKRKLRENNISEDCIFINEDDVGSQSKDTHPESIFIGEEPSSIIQVQCIVSSKSKDQQIFIGEDSPDSSIFVQVQGSISSKSKQITKRLHIIINDKISKKKLVSVKVSPKVYKNIKYHNFNSQTHVSTYNSVISASQFIQLSRQNNHVRRLQQVVDDTRQCSFCHQQGDLPESGAGKLLNFDIDRWLHLNCALWCNDVSETQSGGLNNVPKSVTAVCTACGQPGAGVCCCHPRCTAKYHVPCARDNNCHFQNDRTAYCNQHQSNDVTLRSLSVKRRVYISKDECSQIVTALNQSRRLYIRIGTLSIISIGQLLPHQIHSGHFHNLNHVYPVGFKSQRIHWSSRLKNTRCKYLSEIILDNNRPLFKVTATDENLDDVVYQAHDCHTVWKDVLNKIANLRNKHNLVKYFPELIRGEYLFGLTEPNILRIIESFPGFENVNDYTFTYGKIQLTANTALQFNVSGAIRCEPFHRVSKQAHTIHQSHSFIRYNSTLGQKQERTNLLTMVTSNKWQQYRKLKQESKSNVTLKRSKIQGLGLFAAKDLEKGVMIIEYIGELIRNEIANKREREYESRKRTMYMYRLDDNTVIDATRSGDIARYINHCCEPNCFTEIIECEKESHIVIISKKKIEKNEELTYDYKFDFEDNVLQRKMPCLCGARNCRRWIN